MKLTYEQVNNLKKGDYIRVWKDGRWIDGQIHSTEGGAVPAILLKEKDGNIERVNTGTNFVESAWNKYCHLNIEYQQKIIFDETWTRFEKQPNIFDYLLSSAKERSQAPLVLQREPNGEQDLAFNQLFDEQKQEK